MLKEATITSPRKVISALRNNIFSNAAIVVKVIVGIAPMGIIIKPLIKSKQLTKSN